MPAIGLLTGQRLRLLSRRNPLYKDFVRDTGVNIDMNTFKKIIRTTCRKMAECIATDPEGLQLPEIGYIVVTKYKPKKPVKNKVASKKIGKDVPYLNLHSFGYVHKKVWYKEGIRVRYISVYRMKLLRKVSKNLSNSIIAGTNFFIWQSSDLWSASSLERRFKDNYKKNN